MCIRDRYISSLKRLTESFGELTLSIAENKIYCEHLKKLFEYLDIDASNENNVDILENVVEKEICIEFKNVSFKYPGSDTYVLRNINAEFHSGKRYAIVGMNGSGKTTFVKLLCRLYAPTEGAIYINGIDVKRIDYKEYLKNLAVVFQDFQLFSFGVGQNVSVNTDYDKLKVEQCLMKAGVYDRVSKMSDKLETCLYREDVYKRQVFTPLGYILKDFPGQEKTVYLMVTLPGIAAMIGGFASAGLIPVSYTHLDVYKRQDVNGPAVIHLKKSSGKGCICIHEYIRGGDRHLCGHGQYFWNQLSGF